MWPKIAFVAFVYAIAIFAYQVSDAGPAEDRVMFCNIFQSRFEAFGAALRDGISTERINKVIVEDSRTEQEARMYQMMVRLLLENDLYKDVNAVEQTGMEVKNGCIKGVQR